MGTAPTWCRRAWRRLIGCCYRRYSLLPPQWAVLVRSPIFTVSSAGSGPSGLPHDHPGWSQNTVKAYHSTSPPDSSCASSSRRPSVSQMIYPPCLSSSSTS